MGRSNTNCSVPGCANTLTKATKEKKVLSFYSFPSKPWDKERRQAWIKFMRRVNEDGTPWAPTRNSRVCSEHFVGGTKSEDPRHPAYNPTIFDPRVGPKEDPTILMERYNKQVAEYNRQKEEAKTIEEAEALRISKITKKMKISSAKRIATTLPSNFEVVEVDEFTPGPEPEITEDSRQIICLICCKYCPPSSPTSFQNNGNFLRFCKLLYKNHDNLPYSDCVMETLKSCDHLSLCSSCLSNVDSTVTKNISPNKTSIRVRKLQMSLLKEMKLLQTELNGVRGEMRKLRDSVKNSCESRLNSILIEETAALNTKNIKNSDTVNSFRTKIKQTVEQLEEFGQNLQQKVDCTKNDKKPTVNLSQTDKNQNQQIETMLPSPKVPESDIHEDNSPSPPPPSIPGVIQNQEPEDTGEPDIHEDDPVPLRPPTKPKVFQIPMPKFGDDGTPIAQEPVVVGETTRTDRATDVPEPPPRTNDHVEMMPRRKVSCPGCNKSMLSTYLYVHRKYRCPESPAVKIKKEKSEQLLCHLCSKSFLEMRYLNDHIRLTHSQERPFLCTTCGFTSKSRQGLRRHERSHSSDRPFVCRKGCGAGFKHPNIRNGHEDLCNGKGTPKRKKAKQVVEPTFNEDSTQQNMET